MKQLSVIALFLALVIMPAAAAAPGEPEYNGNFAARDIATGRYIALERLTPTPETRVRGWGFGGAESIIYASGASSNVRFHVGQRIQFVMKVASQDEDPQNLIQFSSLVVKNDRRTLPVVDVHGMFATKAESMARKYAVPFIASKQGKNFFSVEPSAPLAPGEYWISATSIQDAFCFGVDP
jgi:hypothetical protein